MTERVCLVLLTWNRIEYARRTLRAALDNLTYDGSLTVHIADDGSPAGYVDELVALAGGYANVSGVGTSNSQRGGYGSNWNHATQIVHQHADIVLALEDDWELVAPLDLTPVVQDLVKPVAPAYEIRCLRLGRLGWTQSLSGRMFTHGESAYVLFDHDSAEPHVWAGGPRIETVAYERDVGPWPEGLEPGQTEFQVAHWPQARLTVGWPLKMQGRTGEWFVHIGSIPSLQVPEPEEATA